MRCVVARRESAAARCTRPHVPLAVFAGRPHRNPMGRSERIKGMETIVRNVQGSGEWLR